MPGRGRIAWVSLAAPRTAYRSILWRRINDALHMTHSRSEKISIRTSILVFSKIWVVGVRDMLEGVSRFPEHVYFNESFCAMMSKILLY